MKWLILCFVFSISTQLICQQSSSYAFKHLDHTSGLTESTNHFVFKDSHGFVWISSIAGLNRFDGQKIENYASDSRGKKFLDASIIMGKFFEDVNTNVWFSSYEGLHCYERKFDTFEKYVLKDRILNDVNSYYLFAQEKSILWLLIGNQFIYTFDIDQKTFTFKYKLPQEALRILPIQNGNGDLIKVIPFLIGSNSANIRLVTQQFKTEHTIQLAEQDEIFNIIQDKNNIWLCTNNGIISYDQTSNSFHRYSLYQKKTVHATDALLIDNDNLLISTTSQGLLYFDKKRKVFHNSITHHSKNKWSISGNAIRELYIDSDSMLWCSMFREGLDFTSLKKTIWNSFELSDNQLRKLSDISAETLFFDDNLLYAGGYKSGLVVLDSTKKIIRRFTKENNSGLASNHIIKIIQDPFNKQQLYILHWKGLSILNKASMTIRQISSEIYLDACVLKDSSILLPKRLHGMDIISKGKWPEQIPDVSKDFFYLSSYLSQTGSVFLNKNMTSLSKIVNPDKSFRINDLGPISEFNSCFEFPNDTLVYIATSKGVRILNTLSDQFVETPDVLTKIKSKAVHGHGEYLIVSSLEGIYLIHTETERWYQFTQSDGLISTEFNTGSIAFNDFELCFGSNKGISCVDITNLDLPQLNFDITISDVKINDEVVDSLKCAITGYTNLDNIQKLILSYDQNTISLRYQPFALISDQNIQLQYRLIGKDDDWVVSHDGGLRYSNLSPGEYHLQLRANHSSQSENSKIHSIKLVIMAPIYMQSWFRIVMGILLLIIIWFILKSIERRRNTLVRLKLEKKIALHNERIRIAKDMHDDLGSGLSALKLRLDMIRLRKLPPAPEEISNLLAATTNLNKKMKEVIWTVDIQNDNFDKLCLFLYQYANTLFDASNIECTVTLPENLSHLYISGEHRRNIFLCFKEALNNICKHAQADIVKINLSYSENIFTVQITDNGIGMVNTSLDPGSGMGLNNMKNRMSSIGGQFNIDSNHQGTKILLQYYIPSTKG